MVSLDGPLAVCTVRVVLLQPAKTFGILKCHLIVLHLGRDMKLQLLKLKKYSMVSLRLTAHLRPVRLQEDSSCTAADAQGDSKQPSISLEDVQPSLHTRSTPALATTKSLRSRTALADSSAPHATLLDHTGQLHGMITNSSRVFQPRGKYVPNVWSILMWLSGLLSLPACPPGQTVTCSHETAFASSETWRLMPYVGVASKSCS